jgi:hypothetical protein
LDVKIGFFFGIVSLPSSSKLVKHKRVGRAQHSYYECTEKQRTRLTVRPFLPRKSQFGWR